MKNQNKKHFIQDQAQLISYCPLCKRSFSPREAALINSAGPAQLLHITCNFCATALIVLLFSEERGVSSVGLLTDCTEADVSRMTHTEPISADEVLGVHECLVGGQF